MIEIDTLIRLSRLDESEKATIEHLVSIIKDEDVHIMKREDAANKIKRLLYQERKKNV